MKRILIAGGLCGTTMLIASEKIEACCVARGVMVTVTIQNLWETSYVRPGYDLIIEMFPFFENEQCPVISGRPFINHVGEKELLGSIVNLLCMEASA
uniref:hypothetical protein n=1 Tax=Faecalicatena contorta TaxID=39482 RepID=UPI00359C8840